MSEQWNPHPYQLRAAEFMLSRCEAGLFLDPGLGKTSISLQVASILLEEKLVSKVLVIAPMLPMENVWPAEIERWSNFNHLRYCILHGADKERGLTTDADVYIINLEGIPWLTAAGNRRGTLRLDILGADMLIVDESSKFRNTDTQRFRLMKNLLGRFKRRYILTGTPAPKSYMNLFGQMYLLDQGGTFGRFITHFRSEYFTPSGYGGYDWVLKDGSAEKIQQAIKPLVMRLEAKDYLKLPKLLGSLQSEEPWITRVQLPPTARKVYTALEKELLAELASGATITAISHGVAFGKCCQLANGGIYYQDENKQRATEAVHTAKADALADLIDELQGQPALVAYNYAHDLAAIQAALGKDTPYIGGGRKKADVTRLLSRWNAGELPVLAVQSASVAHGLNMQAGGNTLIWYDLPTDLEVYEQLIARLWRQGAKHSSVRVHHLLASGTVDEAKARSLQAKGRMQGDLLTALKDYAKGAQKKVGRR